MGKPHFPSQALLFTGILYSNDDYYIRVLELLISQFGEIAMQTAPIEWNFSDYYKQELGGNILRRFIFFKNLVEQGDIAGIKIITNGIEDRLSSGNRRNINLDPGYLTQAKIVLASTKDYSHRIYLKDGIYAEVTLIFKKDRFVPHINTYMDYREERYMDIFMNARKLFKIISR